MPLPGRLPSPPLTLTQHFLLLLKCAITDCARAYCCTVCCFCVLQGYRLVILRDYAGEIPGITMRVSFVVFFTVIAATAIVAQDVCYKDAARFCKSSIAKKADGLVNCSAKYGSIEKLQSLLQQYVNAHITRNYEYLLMSTYYGNYEKSREGFEKLFRELSDSKWDTAIDLIKYITKRGGQMNFGAVKQDGINGEKGTYELNELEALAKALGMEKELAMEAHHIHGQATRRHEDHHDPEISSYLESKFVHEHAECIRKLAGHVSDLNNLLDGPDGSLALFLFDDYLKKQSIL